jgi:thiamine-phosphate diphosphorylase
VLITDSSRGSTARRSGIAGLIDAVHEAALGGVSVVQLREKRLTTSELVHLGRQVRDAAGERVLFYVNGDIDAALALRADGIHLPEDGATIAAVRARVGVDMLISCAVHSTQAAIRAERDGADIIQFGTIFGSSSKPGVGPAGVDTLRATCEAVSIGTIGVGGITPANAADVIEAGAVGVAVIGAILDAPDPRAVGKALSLAITQAAAGAAAGQRPGVG